MKFFEDLKKFMSKNCRHSTLSVSLLWFIALTAFFAPGHSEAKQPELTPEIVTEKLHEIMKAHAVYKVLTPELIKRTLQNYLDELDPNKTYFLQSDIQQWLNPSPQLLQRILTEYNQSDFSEFFRINDVMVNAIKRRRELEKKINLEVLPKHVNYKEFKDMKWADSEYELMDRWAKIKALQIEASTKLEDNARVFSLQRIAKRQNKYEEQFLNPDPMQRERLVLANVLKATASALDAHSSYFTPEEAQQFVIHVQQRLFGIGAALRDDISGFTVTKIVEGSPAAMGKQLKVKDRIIAVDHEPVVGMDIADAVELIRGEKDTSVTLTVIREVKEDEKTKEQKLDIVVQRGEVVLKEARLESSYEPFGDGVIGYLRLYTFYQDPDSASSTDLAKEIQRMKREHKLLGIVLDLRSNSGGLLSQAVEVTGLFITKGVVVSIKENTGNIQHLRDLDGKMAWDGPLVVLMNRASASASEIVAQTLQDYGRAIVVGDDHSFGKGSFQTFTLNTTRDAPINPQGEYKVTRGMYYTVSGKTPQLTGVISDIVIPGSLSSMDVGEKYAKYPLQNDRIKENYDDDLSDVPFTQREKIRLLYKFDLQPRLHTYAPYMAILKSNSEYRIEHNKNYEAFLEELKKDDNEDEIDEEAADFGQNDLQLTETYNVMRDLIYLMKR
jgi:carboxyl-terminal processing protease